MSELSFDKLELRSDFACYLCVLVRGLVEKVIADIAREHSRSRASKTVTNYIENTLRKNPQNVNTERLIQFVGSFNTEWQDRLGNFVAGERKDALDSVIANCNRIAHGESVDLTFVRINNYYVRICEILAFVDELFA